MAEKLSKSEIGCGSPSRRLLLMDADPTFNHLLTGLSEARERSIRMSRRAGGPGRVRSAAYDLVVAGLGSNGIDVSKLLRRMRENPPRKPR